MSWLRNATIGQWEALIRDYPVRPGTSREQAEVLGVYLVAAFVLVVSEYGTDDLWRLLPWDLTMGSVEWKYWRKLGWVIGVALSYIVPTTLYATLVLKMSPRELGLNAKGFVQHLPMYFAFLGVVLPLVAIVSDDPQFQKTYPLSMHAHERPEWLLGWELCYAFQFVGVEYFFRGFLLFCAARVIGPYAIPAMVVPYVMIHFAKPWPETVGAIIAGSVLAVVALRTRSILAGICIHTAVAWSMDAAALWRTGKLQGLFE